jgi:hypothetical protein
MKHSITIRWLKESNDCESRRRVIFRKPTKVMTTSNKLLRRRAIWRGLNGRRRWHILNERRRWLIRGR